MGADPQTWESIIRAYQSENWHEAVRLTRTLADDDPHSVGVRQLLAALYTLADNPRMAVVQYERLLPLSIGQGDLFGALAAQKHLDRLHPDAPHHAGRFVAMHKWFRSIGRPGPVRDAITEGLIQSDLLGLTAEQFSAAAEATTIEAFGMESQTLTVRPGMLCVVLYGRVTWFVETRDGRRGTPRAARRGDTIVVDQEWGEEAALVLAPEEPCEYLRFDAPVVAEMVREAPALASAVRDWMPVPIAGLKADARTSDREFDLTDVPTQGASSFEPDFGTVELPGPMSLVTGADSALDPTERSLDGPADPGERRRDTRVEIGLGSRLALLGPAGLGVEPLSGHLVDLSVSGLSIRVPGEQLTYVYEQLENALVAIELDFPAPLPALHLAGRVRHFAPQSSGETVVIGVEFVLSTDFDRTRLFEAVQRATESRFRAA